MSRMCLIVAGLVAGLVAGCQSPARAQYCPTCPQAGGLGFSTYALPSYAPQAAPAQYAGCSGGYAGSYGGYSTNYQSSYSGYPGSYGGGYAGVQDTYGALSPIAYNRPIIVYVYERRRERPEFEFAGRFGRR